ncbi:hypothetical protein D6C93_05613 [Aureobasidium pullulans]|nr:hypothetical protein D6C93_05613 [Aureobasidium pullulans]
MFLTFDTPLNFCDICDEDKIWFTVFAAPCGHRFCSDCLTTLFGLCTTDEEVYPPRCCTQTIPLDRVNGGLSRELVETFRAKSIEWETKDRTAVTHALDWSYLLTAATIYLVLAAPNSATFAVLAGCLDLANVVMSDNLPIPSSNTFPHVGHFLYRNRYLLRINQLQIIPVTVKLVLRIHLENT